MDGRHHGLLARAVKTLAPPLMIIKDCDHDMAYKMNVENS